MLESVVRSSVRDLEVVVVDQNPDNRTFSICERYSQALSLRRLQVPFRGAARARNYGARFARGAVINFPDDDCELSQSLLADVKALFDGGGYQVVIGITVDGAGGASTTSFRRDERVLGEWSMWRRNVECTMFFRRATFIASGGYDEEFGVGSTYGSDEGAELLIRLLRMLQPGQVFYSHKLTFYHPQKVGAYGPDEVRRAFSYARGSGALLAKWPTASVVWFSSQLLVRSAVAAVGSVGARRRFYLQRLRGFADGFQAYLRQPRAGARN
jgi:glycosyltransferase involved in cell wall biosynthesis